MSILDDAIREHLELKRQHGADESELKRLEDEAFGRPGRPDGPDPFAEAPTEFMAAPEGPEAAESSEEGSRRRINVADLQEAPPALEEEQAPAVEVAEGELPEAEAEVAAPAEDPAQAAPPAEEEPPAIEHEAVPEAGAAGDTAEVDDADEGADPSAEDRHAIAEQPTELFDVEAEMGTEDAPAPAPSPDDEEIVEAQASEPKLTPVEPATEIHASRTESPEQPPADEYEEDEEFWSDQRLSEELDQALEAPAAREGEDPGPDEGEEHDEYEPEGDHEDVLEDTPDFLEDAPEDDELWFEQRPPKDFDFDD